MKTIRAPKTSGTSYEKNKDLSADKKSNGAELVLWRNDNKGRTCEAPAKAQLCIAELGIAAATPRL